MDLEIRRGFELAEGFGNGLHHALNIARQIFERRLQLEVRHDPFERRGEAILTWVIRTIRWLGRGFIVLDVLRRYSRPHENKVVLEVRAMQDLAAHGVEERLRALGLPVRSQQADVMQLDLLPDFIVYVLGVVLVLQTRHALFHAIVVRRDAFPRKPLQRVPVAGFE